MDELCAFVDLLDKYQLLTKTQLAEVTSVQEEYPTATTLAEELVRRDWLTSFQTKKLLTGNADELLLGPYVLLEPLGAGGMGQVYKARHPLMNRIVAVKLIHPSRLSGSNVQERFQREIQALAQVSHPNIVAAHHAEKFGDTYYLIMEFVEGVDLHRLVKSTGPLDIALACECIRQAALGLHHIHECQLVHRDIKPGNIILAKSGKVVKLLDFGLALLHDEKELAATAGVAQTSGGRLTQTNIVLGTPDYIAPEQAVSLRAADIRADIYSLGCTLFHLLTGRPPFGIGTAEEKIVMHQQTPPPPVTLLRPETPPALSKIVARMMAKDPSDRYATPAEVAHALSPFCSAAPAAPEIREVDAECPATDLLFGTADDTTLSQKASPRRSAVKLFCGIGVVTSLIVGAVIAIVLQFFIPGAEIAETPRDLHIGKGKQFQSINAALQAANPKSRLIVHPGVYDESITLDRPIDIVGKGSRDEIIIKAVDGCCILMQTDVASVRGVTLLSEIGDKQNKNPAVRAGQGRLTMTECAMTSDSHSCVIAHEPGTHVKLVRCKMHDGAIGGLYIHTDARCILEDCELSKNRMGVVTKTKGNPTFIKCRIRDNREHGIFVFNGGLGTFEENTHITANKKAGAAVQDVGSQVIFQKCVIDSQSWAGVAITGGGYCKLFDCKLRDNREQGVVIKDAGSRLVLEHSQVLANKMAGVEVHKDAFARIEHCTFGGNTAGPLLQDPAAKVVSANNKFMK